MSMRSGRKKKNVQITRGYLRSKYAWTINNSGHTVAHLTRIQGQAPCELRISYTCLLSAIHHFASSKVSKHLKPPWAQECNFWKFDTLS